MTLAIGDSSFSVDKLFPAIASQRRAECALVAGSALTGSR